MQVACNHLSGDILIETRDPGFKVLLHPASGLHAHGRRVHGIRLSWEHGQVYELGTPVHFPLRQHDSAPASRGRLHSKRHTHQPFIDFHFVLWSLTRCPYATQRG